MTDRENLIRVYVARQKEQAETQERVKNSKIKLRSS